MKTSHPTWGGRFQKKMDRQVAEFTSSIKFDHRLYMQDIMGSQAHVNMCAKQGLLLENEALKIIQGLEEIKSDIQQGKIIFDVALEDIHMNIEALLEQRIGSVAKKLHTGRSRNDQVALDLRLFVREAIDNIIVLLENVISALEEIATQHEATIMPGYTHLQRAQPITLALHLKAYCAMFTRDSSRFNDTRARMNYSPLGAGALAGSQLPLDRVFAAEQLGFSGIIENTIDAVSDRDYVIEFCANSSILMMHISRLSEDIILWVTQEFNFASLDDAFSTGSSLMPNKRNPDVPELLRGKSGRVFGHLIAMLTIMKGLPLAYNKDMQEDKEALFDCIDTVNACLSILPDFLKSLSFNQEKMREATQTGHLDATFWVEKLVLQGMPFREAHETVGQWVAKAIREGKKIDDVKVIIYFYSLRQKAQGMFYCFCTTMLPIE